jgi:phosphatidylglycerophosphate synthase
MGHTTGAKWAGKMKMILQSFILPLILLLVVNFNPEKYAGVMLAINALAWVLLVVTVWSGLPYVTGLVAVMRKDS